MSLFGQQQSGGGLFGSTTTQPQSGGLFGNTTTQTQQTSGGLFGQPTQQTQQQPQPQQQTGGLFGQQPQQQQQQTGGLFGQSTQQQQPQQTGGLFGQSTQQQQPQQTGGLFGQPTQQQQPQQTGGLFGQPTQQQQPQQTGGLFGQSTAQSGGGLFGQTQPQQQTGGLFGSTTTAQPQQQTGGLFGGQTGGLFGGTQMQPQTGGLFGQSAAQPQSMQLGGLGGSMLGSVNQQSQIQQQAVNPIVEKVQRVKNSWDVNHPDYAFKYYFYNYVGKEKASQFQKPPNEDLESWEKAWSERPNDGCVPVRANGFKDLEARVKAQESTVNNFRHTLHGIQEKLNAIQNQHDLNTSIKLEDCQRRHQALARRALSLAAKVQVLKNRGYALQPEEEALKKRLEGLARTVQDPATSGRMNEIWARMMVVQEKAKAMEESMGKVEIVWEEHQLQVTGKLLESNFKGLDYLRKEVLDIERQFQEWQEQHQNRTGGL